MWFVDRLLFDDEIKENISLIFDSRVGKPYEEERLKEIFKEGFDRYKQKIPPGYMDAGKAGGGESVADQCREYGDLIVWHQIIDKSISSKKPIFFVTDDQKEDWWEKTMGKTIGPRPELITEFKHKTGNIIHMYQPNRFLELAGKNLDESVSEEFVNEVRDVSSSFRVEPDANDSENGDRLKLLELRYNVMGIYLLKI